ncbi:hypothetical protein, partial [Parafrankia soli]|uniref:hypothetical protein n=1 Tax=Parafrankia soli TaxID=2599596 RepID=UPI001F526B28
LYSGSIATATPQTFTVASPPPELRGFGVDDGHELPDRRALLTDPYPPGLSTASRLRSFDHWFTSVTPSDLAEQARAVWQSRRDLSSSGPLATLPSVPPGQAAPWLH